MPKVNLNKDIFEKLVGKKLGLEELKDRISMLGTDLEKIEGNTIEVEVFPNRPDMLSEQGFARAFSSFIGVKTGLKKYEVKHSKEKCIVKSIPKEWPYVVTAIVKGLQFDDEKIREVVQIQEKLAITYLRNRKKGGIGLYPLNQITFPITFTGKNPKDIVFRPLEYPQEISGSKILSDHPTGRKYGHICEGWSKYPVFIDANKKIMSMPPIINSHEIGKIDEHTKDVFVEATGTDLNILKTTLNILVTALADMGGSIYSMDIEYATKKETTPHLAHSTMQLDNNYVNTRLGLELTEHEIKILLEKMGFGYLKGIVQIPCYRADIMHPIDLVEDIAIAYGYENFIEEIPNVSTIGEENPFHIYIQKIATILSQLGLIETKTYHLTNNEIVNKKMGTDLPCIILANSFSEEYSLLRPWVLPSLMDVLSKNKHHEYPQNLFDIGTAFIKDTSQETNVSEVIRLAVVVADTRANYTDARQILVHLISSLDMKINIEETDHSSFIPGRVGRGIVNGKKVAYIGELHPAVLEHFGLSIPVSGFELNLTELFKL